MNGVYRKSLAISESLDNQAGMATTYHQLGMVEQARGKWDSAEQWYRKSLAIEESLGNQADMASTYHQLGLLAEDRGEPERALDWMIRALLIYLTRQDRDIAIAFKVLARLTRGLGFEVLAARWRALAGEDLPAHVREIIERGIAELDAEEQAGSAPS